MRATTTFRRLIDGGQARGERGVTLVTFALSILAICAVVALILGGSLGYDAERNSQTSSDSAALAATSALREAQLSSPTQLSDFDGVLIAADSLAKANGANNDEDVGCELIAADRSTITECASATLTQFVNASGVRVGTRDSRDVPFGEVTNSSTITGATRAAATLQPLKSGNSPFMLCSSSGGPEGHEYEILEDTDPYDINPAWDEGDEWWFLLWGEDMKNGNRQCGGSSNSWRGWVANDDDPYALPGWWEIDTGNKNGHLVPRLVIDPAGCDVADGADIDSLDGCVVVVPLCTHSNNDSGNNLELYCVRYGAFELSYHFNDDAADVPCQRGSDNANKVLCGKFLGGRTGTGGQGSEEQAGINDVVVIKLVE